MNKRILVVDDDDLMREFVAETVRRSGFSVETASCGNEALASLEKAGCDLMITDLKMPDIDGLELLSRLRKTDAETLVIVMTAYGTIGDAVTAIKNGAFDFMTKPFSADVLDVCVRKAFEFQGLYQENKYLRQEIESRYNQGEMVGDTKSMLEIYETIGQVAQSRASVFIQGDSGTGKELVARAIHRQSPRADKPFVRINCAAVVETLLESELFGHEKGAFTGAANRRPGRFELADGGTLFLDEISEMGGHLQAKLLRVLQEREFERVGGNETLKVDVRIISATNRHIEEDVASGKFRKDLFYRLNVVPVCLPALCERTEDIPSLVDFFLDKFNKENGRKIKSFTPKAIDLLVKYTWPGNIRELENLVERMVVLAKRSTIRHNDLPLNIQRGQSRDEIIEFVVGTTIYDAEKALIEKTYESCKQNKTRAAEMLGISVRKLFDRIKEFGLDHQL